MVRNMCPPPGAMMTAAPVALSFEGRNGVIDGLWMLKVIGKVMLFSGSSRQSTFSGSDLRDSEPGAPFGQSGMEAGWSDSLAGSLGTAAKAMAEVSSTRGMMVT